MTITATAVIPPVPDVITPGRVEFRTQKNQWRIEGTVTGPLPDLVTAQLGDATGPEIGEVAAEPPEPGDPDPANPFDLRRDLLPAEAGLRPVPGAVVTLTSSRGASRVVAVTVRN